MKAEIYVFSDTPLVAVGTKRQGTPAVIPASCDSGSEEGGLVWGQGGQDLGSSVEAADQQGLRSGMDVWRRGNQC